MSVVTDLTKWLKRNWPHATPLQRRMVEQAYLAGRNDLLAAQKRKAAHLTRGKVAVVDKP